MADFARRLGVNRSSITRAVQRGDLLLTENGIDLDSKKTLQYAADALYKTMWDRGDVRIGIDWKNKLKKVLQHEKN